MLNPAASSPSAQARALEVDGDKDDVLWDRDAGALEPAPFVRLRLGRVDLENPDVAHPLGLPVRERVVAGAERDELSYAASDGVAQP